MQETGKLNQFLHQVLFDVWGFQGFKSPQMEIISAIISGKDVVALLPTGGGKSLCYQLPSLVLEGTCLVVSPLLALMKDQVLQLKAKGVEAEYLSSELDEAQEEDIYNRCIEGLVRMLYVSPERLSNRLFLEKINEIKCSFLAIDEAHCISEWGQDFRPSYHKIKAFREMLKGIPCMALTATATPKVLQDISEKLNLKSPAIFQKSFRRENISIVHYNLADKYQRILDILKSKASSGIIYTRTRKEAEDLTEFLKKKGLRNVNYFHAGLTAKEKTARQKQWQESTTDILISTNAFGMGIDKEDVRFVLHLSPPASLESYYQEIGRAGRDHKDSMAFLLWNEAEMRNIDEIYFNQIPNKSEYLNIISYLYSHFQIAENELPETTFQLNFEKVQNFTKSSFAKIKNVFGFLHNQELIFLNTMKSLSSLELKISPDDLELISKKDAYFVELLLRNLPGVATKKVFFSETNLAHKTQTNANLIKQRIKDLQYLGYLDYIDGMEASVKFLKHRESRSLEKKYWDLFQNIQKNKLKKWEEMKFYIRNQDHCKMKLILSYFGEKKMDLCNNCYICGARDKSNKGSVLRNQILHLLGIAPRSLDELASELYFSPKEKILEQLLLFLELEEVKMLDYKTYTLKQ